jgi:DNA-binding transcriptional ArsR family regulator
MVEYKRWNPDAVFSALASASRRELLSRIARKRCRISDLAKGMPVTFAAVSKNLQVLERAGLVDRQKEGRSYYFLLRTEPLSRAEEVLRKLSEFWSERLDALAQLAEAERPETQHLQPRNKEP